MQESYLWTVEDIVAVLVGIFCNNIVDEKSKYIRSSQRLPCGRTTAISP